MKLIFAVRTTGHRTVARLAKDGLACYNGTTNPAQLEIAVLILLMGLVIAIGIYAFVVYLCVRLHMTITEWWRNRK